MPNRIETVNGFLEKSTADGRWIVTSGFGIFPLTPDLSAKHDEAGGTAGEVEAKVQDRFVIEFHFTQPFTDKPEQ